LPEKRDQNIIVGYNSIVPDNYVLVTFFGQILWLNFCFYSMGANVVLTAFVHLMHSAAEFFKLMYEFPCYC